jgi:hypothetical protein
VKITNTHKLPDAVYTAICADNYEPKPDILRVTEFVAPPLIKQLSLKHWDEMVEDASERLWALYGSAIHYAIGRFDMDNAFKEERLAITVGDITITGQFDFFKDGGVEDYKMTSVWSYIFGDKPEWTAQGNMYAELLREIGFEVTKPTKFNLILRDWRRSEALQGGDYPQIPFQTIEAPLWTRDECHNYIGERLVAHLNPAKECSDKEKWARPTTWAVMKEGNKKATKVFGKYEDAYVFISGLEKDVRKYSIIERKGSFTRCEGYCPVRQFCPYAPKTKEGDE